MSGAISRIIRMGCLMLAMTPPAAQAQDNPISKDVATLDGIIDAYYEVVSGPAGQPRQWERDRSLHHPEGPDHHRSQ